MSPAAKRQRKKSASATHATEAAVFLQDLRALNMSLGRQVGPVLEKEQGIDLRLYCILYAVAQGVVHPSAIAQTSCLPNSLVSKHLDQLVALGLLARSLDPQDTRRIRMKLSAKGKRVRHDAERIFTALVGKRLARLPAARRGAFLTTLAALAHEAE